jgi:predicted dehydrogenase/aryl-alcohol dehydrogenase-like predicted oxidoreductase
MSRLNWGILGTGAIAKTFANGLKQSQTGKLVAVGSRSRESAEAFGTAQRIAIFHGSYEELLNDSGVDAIYISTPHPFHAEWTIKAVGAGKHVLCEKPLALNQWQAQAMFAAARKAGVYLSEAFMYRFHPQMAKLVELIRDGAVGEVRMIRASFGFGGGDKIDPESRLFKNELGGGGILDVGCYAVSGARLVAGAAIGEGFDNPVKVAAAGKVGSTDVDEWAAAVLQFESGITAQVATSIRARLDNVMEIRGSLGKLLVPDPWAANREEGVCGEIIQETGNEEIVHSVPAGATSFALEADGVARAIAAGCCEPEPPAMTWDDTLGNMAVLDEWRRQVGVVYADEKPARHSRSIAGRKVAVARPASPPAMRYGTIPGLEKPVSRFIFGALTAHGSFAKGQVLFDNWLECGGNAFDTGYQYGSGQCDGLLGNWLASRGVRDEVVIVAKGAHTPECNPEGLTRQLLVSLEKLQTDHTDIYIMHRDNEDIPAGEFVDVLNEHVEAGRIKVFGGSNWSPQRFAEANAWAEKHGKQGMSILNNNLSLARMIDPVWPGCIHMSDTNSRQWLAANNIVHFAWSSQARGFFTGRTDCEIQKPGYDAELRRCWMDRDNLNRRKRAMELAKQRGVLPINIAAAYVLYQPFESYALIGPESIDEMETSLPALELELSAKEIAYLWGGD